MGFSLSSLFKGAAGFMLGGPIGAGLSMAQDYDARRDARHAHKRQLAGTYTASKNQVLGTVAGAREAGLHPLFALGGGGAGIPAPVLPDQSNSGSRYFDAILQILAADKKADLNESQANLSNARAAEARMQNDVAHAAAAGLTLNPYNPRFQEMKKGEVQPGRASDPSQNLNVKRAWTRTYFIPGSKDYLLLPAEEPSEVFDSLALATMTYLHPHNKPIIDAWLKERAPMLNAVLNPQAALKAFWKDAKARGEKNRPHLEKLFKNFSKGHGRVPPKYENWSRDFPGR